MTRKAVDLRKGVVSVAVMAAFSWGALACGSSADADAVSARTSEAGSSTSEPEPATTEPEPATTEPEPEPETTEPEPDESEQQPEDLLGTWAVSGAITWQIDADSIIVTGGPVDEQSYSATSTTLEMTDVSGPRACPRNQVGTYEWLIVDDVLTLSLVRDACGGRGAALDGMKVTRQ